MPSLQTYFLLRFSLTDSLKFLFKLTFRLLKEINFNHFFVNIFTGKTLYIKCIGKVANFSELRVGRVGLPLGTTEMRKRRLKLRFQLNNFDCDCILCKDPNSDLLYSSRNCPQCIGGCVPIATKICINCK